jgi:ADP-heptose:LPS heptosyltransferase
MPFQPACVLDGKLDLAAFVALLRRAQFYLGTDCGALHLAFMAKRPSFSWFRDAGRTANWLSDVSGSEGLVGRPGVSSLEGLPAPEMIEKVQAFIEKLEKARTQNPNQPAAI